MMISNVPIEFCRFSHNCEDLKRIFKETHCALHDIQINDLISQDIKEQLFAPKQSESLHSILNANPIILVFGQNCHAKAMFINTVLGQMVLPLYSSKWRWVKLSYGHRKNIRLTLGSEFEIVEKLKPQEEKWVTVLEEDLLRKDSESPLEHCPTLEVDLCHEILKENVTIMIPPDCDGDQFGDVLTRYVDHVLPIITYAISGDVLNDTDIQEVRILKEKYRDLPILFVSVSECEIGTDSLTESEQHLVERGADKDRRLMNIGDQLRRLGYLNETNTQNDEIKSTVCTECSLENSLISDKDVNVSLVPFIKNVLHSYLLKMSTMLSEIHNNCLRVFILSAFDMAREIQITPKRIVYAQIVEKKLYESLLKIACDKQEEIMRIIQITLSNMRQNVGEVLQGYEYRCEDGQPSVKMATMEIHQLVLKRLSMSVATQLLQSVACLQDNYVGTLQRCLQSLEKSSEQIEGGLSASDAVNQILSAAYNVDLKSSTKFTIVHSFIDRLRNLVHNFQLPWTASTQPRFDFQWQVQVVYGLIDSLSSCKLAKTISAQFQEHVTSSHEYFRAALRLLEKQLSGKLVLTEEQRIAIRKRHAPRFAKLSLESTSLGDYLRYGMPKQTREIGRGQYGVVFSCEPWGNVSPCAVKSVVPPDDRHWNDLAMEFYYTRTIPEHVRIVKLRGSVIDKSYAGGLSPAVLLIMEQMTRDLYCGLRSGLSWAKRIQIAIDVVEGIRYLHSQGLVHRDIKLKNVLLDIEDRAKLTDFGFCIPEPMMSGSVVGTPVHMAPELLSGRYDSSVDVYAFGILFWYICAGQVKLPSHFEQFNNKEQLWANVSRGIRPECLPYFTQSCWNLMEQCWASEPYERPLLGYVQPQLEAIQRSIIEKPGKLLTNSNVRVNRQTGLEESSLMYPGVYNTRLRHVDKPSESYYYHYDMIQLREY